MILIFNQNKNQQSAINFQYQIQMSIKIEFIIKIHIQQINNFQVMKQLKLYQILNKQRNMSYYHRTSSPYKLNQNDLSYVKMQNLLEQYDRQNQFLGKQVTDLLKINKLLHAKGTLDISQKIHCNPEIESKKYAKDIQSSYKRNRFERNQKIYSKQLTQVKKQVKKEILKNQSQSQKQKQSQKAVETAKKVKFSRDPYIQASDIRTVRETSENKSNHDDEKNSPLKKHQSINLGILTTAKGKEKKQYTGKKPKFGLQLIEKSLSKQKQRTESLTKSKILAQSNRSSKSKKSGISVISQEVSPEKNKNLSPEKIELPMSAKNKKLLQCLPIEKSEQKVLRNGSQNKNIHTKTQPALSFQRTHSVSFINHGSKQLAPVIQNHPAVDYMKSGSVADIFERGTSQSKHRIEPSTKIYHESNLQLVQRKKSCDSASASNIRSKKKFINLVSKALIQKNIELKKYSFKK